jgi:hypothetical protein
VALGERPLGEQGDVSVIEEDALNAGDDGKS